MGWVKLDDDFYDNVKFASAGPLGMAMWVAALAWCNRNQTDGHLPKSVVKRLLDFDGLAWHSTSSDRTFGMGMDVEWQHVVDDLLKARLWDENGTDYLVHDYLEHQRSAAQVQELTAARRAAGRLGGSKTQASAKQNPSKTEAEEEVRSKKLPPSETREDVAALCALLASLVAANCDGKTPNITAKWRDEARRLIDIDGVSVTDAEKVMRWATADSFWKSNILSMPKFREKYQTLKLRMRSEPSPNNPYNER